MTRPDSTIQVWKVDLPIGDLGPATPGVESTRAAHVLGTDPMKDTDIRPLEHSLDALGGVAICPQGCALIVSGKLASRVIDFDVSIMCACNGDVGRHWPSPTGCWPRARPVPKPCPSAASITRPDRARPAGTAL